ncbi:Outer membrane cobalamin translocator [Gammaproteobacteria bacterium MOLA455]|nr:Outer membrane cobalamin translocator [Gammaproteobacteria bacterium MOLA455]
MTKLYAVFVLLSLACNPTFAENSLNSDVDFAGFYGDEDYVSIATGTTQPIAKAPAVASVITASQISAMGARDIDQVLESVPGLHISRDVIGYNAQYLFRGISSDFNPQVLMLINGIPITNLFQGDRNVVWGGMPVESISRIEVIRGPGSALYGADAFAGVINIVTKTADEVKRNSAGVRVGSFDTTDVWFTGAGEKGELGYMGTIEFTKTDGSDAVISGDAQSLLDLITGTAVSNAPGSVNRSAENIELRLEASYKKLRLRAGSQIRNNIGDGAGAAQALNPGNKFSSQRFNVDLTYTDEDIFDNTLIEFQTSYFDTSQEVEGNFILYPAGSTGPFLDPFGVPFFPPFPDGVIGNPEIFERHTRFGMRLEHSGISKHRISAGAGYYDGEIDKITEWKNFGINPDTMFPILPGDPLVDVSDTPFVFLTEDSRDNKYVFLQDVWQLANDWELTAGLRHDSYSDFGLTTNPRLALVWSTSYKLTTKLLYGEAFRAPSFAQTRAINNPLILGNINLKPEEIKSYELAFDYRPNYELTLMTNFFYYDWTDIIQFKSDTNNSTRTAQNSGEQTGYGMEFEATWQATDNFTLTGNFAMQNSTDETQDVPAAKSPEKQLYLRADWVFPKDWRVNVRANWVMDRNRLSGDMRPDIDDYIVFDLSLRNVMSNTFEFALTVNNLFDEDAREPSPNSDPRPFIFNDLPLSGRALLGEIRYSF